MKMWRVTNNGQFVILLNVMWHCLPIVVFIVRSDLQDTKIIIAALIRERGPRK